MSAKRTPMAEALRQAAGDIRRHAPSPANSGSALASKQKEKPGTGVPIPPSRVGKKPVTGFFDPSVSRQIKKLALEQDTTMQDLLQEAFNDLFRKYGLPPIAG